MQLPIDCPSDLKKYAKFQSDEELLEELEKHPRDLIHFFLCACEDESWIESHALVIQGILNWLTDANINQNYPNEYFPQVIVLIQQHINVLKPLIPLDLILKVNQTDYKINSFLLSSQSYYFRRRILNECRGMKNPILKVDGIPLQIIQLIDEFTLHGEIQDLWKTSSDELWSIIDQIAPLGLLPIVEACEEILRRYINSDSVFKMLIKAHRKLLQFLQNACIEFINEQDLGIKLIITPASFLSLEFFDYKEKAIEAFNQLSSDITHLTFSGELATGAHFKNVVNQCPKLIGLDLSDSSQASNYLIDVPNYIQELRLSRCQWINPASLQIISIACPKLTQLDLSSNEQLTYVFWSELQSLKKISSLDVSFCFQIGDNELRMILQACPRLVDLKIRDCQKITSEGFFDIGRALSDLSHLNISRTLISDAALIEIMSSCKNLYTLDISRCTELLKRGFWRGLETALGSRPLTSGIVI